jgi:hypothetical protein
VIEKAQNPVPAVTVHPIVFRDDKNSRKLSEQQATPASVDS